MSQALTDVSGRVTPRWSVLAQVALLPALIAGLPVSNARVWVNPPLSARTASLGSVLLNE